jgi:hypothetical protein
MVLPSEIEGISLSSEFDAYHVFIWLWGLKDPQSADHFRETFYELAELNDLHVSWHKGATNEWSLQFLQTLEVLDRLN